jgi:phospholipid/cholesterol/gamma-HCH transport system substrate-binding protein
MRAIREHLRDFIAIAALMAVGLAVTGVILSQQQQPYPSWVPFLGDDQFELKAEFETGQAVTPGQGQTVNMAGVEIGDITDVQLDGGRAVVTMGINEPYEELIREDATMLLRPRTGLQDMTVEVQPGDRGDPVAEGALIPLSQTQPNVNPDQILASLDGDTRAYLKLLIQGGATGLRDRGKQLSASLRRFEPLALYLAEIGDALAVRRQNIRRAISSFRDVSEELGASDTRLTEFVVSQNEVLGSFADQEAAIRLTLREFPSALRATRGALVSGDRLSAELGPAARALIPQAQALVPAQQATQDFFVDTVGPIRAQIRPFTTEVRPAVRHLAEGAAPLADTTRGLGNSLGELNSLFNGLSYNPPGQQEGYLFWLAWLNHNTNNLFLTQDAHGPLRRGVVLQSCNTADLAEGFASTRPFIRTLQQVTNVASADQICSLDPPATAPFRPGPSR